MALVEMVMPKMGESIMEGTVLRWLKQVGDRIEEDESVLEVATDKVDTEVPAIQGGILSKILANEGDVIPVGQAIALIDTTGDGTVPTSEPAAASTISDPEPAATLNAVSNPTVAVAAPVEAASAPSLVKAKQVFEGRFYSPLVMNIAREENISMAELEQIPGTGNEGRVTKKDILEYLEHRHETQDNKAAAAPEAATPVEITAPVSTPAQETAQPAPKPTIAAQPAVSVSGNVEIIEMDRMRKMIAQRMVDSKRIAPHVTSFVEADVTNIVMWRNKMKDAYQKREGENLTFTPIFIEAVAKAIKDFPMINISVDGDRIVRKRDINIGMAVALPSGNLIVPVIKNADQMNLNGITKKVNDLANRARINKLTPDDLSDGTYTLTNVGSFGNVLGTPIIMQPQVAIMAVGAIKKKPAVIETPQGDLIGIRHFMFLSHSYDHRVVDGSLGGMFVKRVADYLEGFDLDTKI
ncbi:dihydrolipoamide acetyltransferase family protein [Adhaeribacter pallidiroseus]|uniref:Dihydrolipoamide acetyltransferase component of pyruvate dehydrogenase complex n=1 Tax=Adhaeribacter pallidiroseus TaxID=2072847 RepID=A0A369QQB3_9BACT|nr:dihydrolipoamide acetyltransferase family protein [Adhaeribacter pallidiroseus]RDC66492.1 Dihydrolipoyllysine-residue succinyltransferase [Adhaeribacter pallidiroseus]